MPEQEERIIIDYLRPRDWLALLHAADELNLKVGGYFDRRGNTVYLWAGPEDKPAGWPPEVPITPDVAAWPEPRAYVANLRLRWPGDPAWESDAAQPVGLSISVSEVEMWRLGYGRRPGEGLLDWASRWPEGVTGDARVDGDEAWCRQQWRILKAYAGVADDSPEADSQDAGENGGQDARAG